MKNTIENGLRSNLSLYVLLIIGFSLTANQVHAQESTYKAQVDAIKQAFEDKTPNVLLPHISTELVFLPYPAIATKPILVQVFSNLPKLNELTILDTKEGEVLLKYDFTALGIRESKLAFDETGKITKIELIENLLEEQQKAQLALQNSVQVPNPGKLGEEYPPKEIEFPSKDGVLIVGNLYEINPKAPVILLCHQAGYNKFEYADIAPKLNKMGFNVLAIDQRSGGDFGGQENETFKSAKESGLEEITMLDAEQDILSAVDFLSKKYGRKITVWGSSYSSSLALFVANGNDKIHGVIAFSPGDYFGDEKPKLKTVVQNLEQPFLVTSSKEESAQLAEVLSGIDLENNQSQFIPEGDGFHGSRVLWEGQKGAEEYWATVREFLYSLYPSTK